VTSGVRLAVAINSPWREKGLRALRLVDECTRIIELDRKAILLGSTR
jgi:hypothetical protein